MLINSDVPLRLASCQPGPSTCLPLVGLVSGGRPEEVQSPFWPQMLSDPTKATQFGCGAAQFMPALPKGAGPKSDESHCENPAIRFSVASTVVAEPSTRPLAVSLVSHGRLPP